MAIVEHIHTTGNGLTPKQLSELREAAKRPITFDMYCPELTDEQLAEFRPANFSSMEERAQAMRAAAKDPRPKKSPALGAVSNK